MEKFLEFLITPLLSEPKSLKLKTESSQITIQIADADTGRVIGKQGSVINAIRTLAKTYCALHQLPPVNINLLAGPKK